MRQKEKMSASAEPADKRRIFVSHATLDRAAAERIVAALEQLGLPCWMAPRDIPFGHDYQEEIVVAIESAAAMLVLLSKNSSKSKEIPKETSIASHIGRLMIPVRLDDAEPGTALRYQLTSTQWIDLSSDFDGKIRELAGRLARQFDPTRAGQPPRTRWRRRTGVVAALVFAALALACWPAWHVLQPWMNSLVEARTPLQAQVAPSTLAAAPQPAETVDARVKAFVVAYYQALSGPPGRAVEFLEQRISDPVEFYGRLLPRRVLVAEEEPYVQRWPERSFTIEPGSLQVSCAPQHCSASGLIDYTLRSRARHVVSSGTERFDLRVSVVPMSLASISTAPVDRQSTPLP